MATMRARVLRFFQGLLWLGLSCSWLGHLGAWYWIVDLLSHFRWQYALFSLVVMLLAAFRRWRPLSITAGLTLMVNAWLLSGIGDLQPPPQRHEKALRVICFNVLVPNPNKKQVLDSLATSNADIIALLEIDGRWREAMQPLKAQYPYSFQGGYTARGQYTDIMLWSRLPLLETKILDAEELGLDRASGVLPSLAVRVKPVAAACPEMTVIVTHPLPPMNARLAKIHPITLRALAAWASAPERSGPMLLIGDLNASPWSAIMREVLSQSALRFRTHEFVSQPTWDSHGLLAIPIDHTLATKELHIMSRKLGPSMGSDHRPQEVEVVYALPGH
jgi:endonuclease/exonuclease/phosphatase (EEP) superfamily protein YafD